MAAILVVSSGFLLFSTDLSSAKVTGRCDDCHTMHNSQEGTVVAAGTVYGDGAYVALTNNTCVGCHSSSESSTTYLLGEATVPVVNYTGGGAPSDYLAGGNFYWVKQGNAGADDTKGHNVFLNEGDGNLLQAPGQPPSCGNDACHENLSTPYGGSFEDLNGTYGCEGCHLHVAHHADDGNPGEYKLVDTAAQGWYRFVSAHPSFVGTPSGVAGGEDPDWQATNSSSDHNEYLGYEVTGGYGFSDIAANTMTAFCTGCHGLFHSDQGSTGVWVRHPSDAALPAGEYADYTIYNPMAPVARNAIPVAPSATAFGDATGAMVMCLSCHRPHASPYPDILRWDYTAMNAGSGSTNTNGCFICHTQKDGVLGN